MSIHSIQCALVRGGTTKGVFINSDQLPTDGKLRDQVLLALFGSPDIRQINGLGGGDPLTSKVALVSLSNEPGVDIEYQSGEVGIDEGVINYSTMCGNLASGVGIFALATGMIEANSQELKVRIRNINTGKLLEALIPIGANNAVPCANCEGVDGIKGGGTEIKLTFIEPAGSITGKLLPTGNTTDDIKIGDCRYPCSIVDCGTLYAFFRADNFGLTGSELPDALDGHTSFRHLVENLREHVAQLISSVNLKTFSERHIKIAIFSDLTAGHEGCTEICARVINRYKTHRAFPVTGAICMSAANAIPGTLLHLDNHYSPAVQAVTIHHPAGSICTTSQCVKRNEKIDVSYTTVNRSARILLSGTAYCFTE